MCNPTEALYECCDCGATVTEATWPDHILTCPRPHPPDPADRMPMVNPYVGQLMIELLDIIRIRPPHDAPHVTRATDHADIPITNTSVLRLLRRPLDQCTTAAVTAELARYCDGYLKWARELPAQHRLMHEYIEKYYGPREPRTQDWDTDDQSRRAEEQTRLRHCIKTAVAR